MTPFGDCLKAFRQARSVQQADLAERLGVSRCYISALEQGRKVPAKSKFIDKITNSLSLSSSERQRLFDSLEKSRQIWKVPSDMALEEYDLVHALWERLGSLDKKQIQGMRLFLEFQLEEDRPR